MITAYDKTSITGFQNGPLSCMITGMFESSAAKTNADLNKANILLTKLNSVFSKHFAVIESDLIVHEYYRFPNIHRKPLLQNGKQIDEAIISIVQQTVDQLKANNWIIE